MEKSETYLIVDRMEQDTVLCETEQLSHVSIPLSLLPDGVKEGDVLKQMGNRYEIDLAETEKRRKRIISLQKKLFHKTSGEA